jgi:hypothetical protein
MNDQILVCPFDKKLLSKLNHRAVILRTDRFEDILEVHPCLPPSSRLQAVVVETDLPLSRIPYDESWGDTPLVIQASELGLLREFLGKYDLVMRLNLNFFLPSSGGKTCLNLHLLSSLRIRSGIRFEPGAVDWEQVNDLMHYALYAKTNHAPIEPFHYVAEHYDPRRYLDFNSVYFDDPSKYLHVNSQEQIAFTGGELRQGRFFAEGLASLATLDDNEAYRQRLRAWQGHFLQPGECSCCEGWRICLGKFAESAGPAAPCQKFFSELMDASEYHHKIRIDRGRREWRY